MQSIYKSEAETDHTNTIVTVDAPSVWVDPIKLLISGTSITVIVSQAVDASDSVWQAIQANITTAGLHTITPFPKRTLKFDITATDARVHIIQLPTL